MNVYISIASVRRKSRPTDQGRSGYDYISFCMKSRYSSLSLSLSCYKYVVFYSRVFYILLIFVSVVFLLAFNNEVARLLVAANELGMMNGEYAFLTLDFEIQNSWQTEPWVGGRNKTEFQALFDGIVNLSVKGPHGERFTNFSRQLSEKMKANNVSRTSVVSM